MPPQKIKFLSKKEVAIGTNEFDFAKPLEFSYAAGQYLIWRFPDLSPVDEKGNQRDLTISSAPFEKHLSFATRLRDTSFKNWVLQMHPGDEIEIDGPHGHLVLPEKTNKEVVFLAGGIGVTPFKSIAVQAARDKSPQKIKLFHFDKSAKDMPYFQELHDLHKINPNFQYIPALTTPTPDWSSDNGHLTPDLLKKYLNTNPARIAPARNASHTEAGGTQSVAGGLNSYLYFAAGPPAMVEAIRDTLVYEAKISAENILSENFGGY